MKSSKTKTSYFLFNRKFLILSAIFLALSGCKKNVDNPTIQNDISTTDAQFKKSVKQLKNFDQINLVANNAEYPPARIDPVLLNAWGLAFTPNGFAWIGAQAGHVSTVYNSEGGEVRPPVNIPSPGGPTGGNPTGVVFSGSTTDFILPAPNNQPARFLFVGVDGVLSGWNGAAGNNAIRIKNNVATSAYTGLALASNAGANFLYAANFRAGRIDVWDNHFNTVSMPFTDPGLPAGYSPFNIQKVDNVLYVAYAKIGSNGRSEEGLGKGYVDIYNTNGALIKRFASGEQLDAPWGITKAPATFLGKENEKDEDHQDILLIGNFGNGHINAYRSDGKFMGELANHKKPIVIDELWAITFAPTTASPAIDPNRLYFTAGPDEEADGLFGYIKRQPDND
jgi:uncharacterized protein (TIGR03118 family)